MPFTLLRTPDIRIFVIAHRIPLRSRHMNFKRNLALCVSLSLSLSLIHNHIQIKNSVKHVFVIFAFYLPLQKTRKDGLCDEKTCFGSANNNGAD